MCTSFVWRKDDVFVGMNFDNNGMPFSVGTKNPSQFIVSVDGGRGKTPSFGVNSDGIFINNLMVDSNGKGLYKRASKKVTHTSKLTGDILGRTILPDEINLYLESTEVVNDPNFSVHNMLADKEGNVWIVEPGRGIIHSTAEKSKFFVMSNFSLCDFGGEGTPEGDGADRYLVAEDMLQKCNSMSVDSAFQILEAVRQSAGEWQTAFSMVYSQKENAVYYCYNGEFDGDEKVMLLDLSK